jgi:hypothetical protein
VCALDVVLTFVTSFIPCIIWCTPTAALDARIKKKMHKLNMADGHDFDGCD